ncbi:hypothetical protein Q7P37_000212 [Cladosporium fusiforme]
MSFSQFQCLPRSYSPKTTFEPFDFEQILEYLEEPTDNETDGVDGLGCDPKNSKCNPKCTIVKKSKLTISVHKDVRQDSLLAASEDLPTATGATNPQKESAILQPGIDWENWSFGQHDFTASDGYIDLSSQFLRSDVPYQQSVESHQSPHQTLAMFDMDKRDSNLVRATDDTVVPLAQRASFPANDSSKNCTGKPQADPEPGEKAGKECRRAKNRSAAIKCRAKKRSDAKVLKEAFEQSSFQNTFLKHEERKLRGLITSLRDCALQHDPRRCSCKSLHAFNKKRAEQIFQRMDSSGSSST